MESFTLKRHTFFFQNKNNSKATHHFGPQTFDLQVAKKSLRIQ